MKKLIYSVLAVALMCISMTANAKSVKSPDKLYNLDFDVQVGELFYNVTYDGKTIISDSQLSLNLQDKTALSGNFEIVKTYRDSYSGSWKPVAGSKSVYPDNYNEMRVDLRETTGEKRSLTLVFRAYNEGVAFRYEVPKQAGLDGYTISAEKSEFKFTGNHNVFYSEYPQADYVEVPLSQMPPNAIRPLLMDAGDHFIAIAEAGSLEFYAPLKLDRAGKNALVSGFRAGTVKVEGDLVTPWRVIMTAKNAGTLVENHYLLQNLSPECEIEDTSWIKGGKCWRSGLTTDSAKAIIDYAAEHNYQYVHYDAGWYGPERAKSSHPRKPIEGIDMKDVIEYGNSKGIGLICYINKIAIFDYDMETTFKLYKEWGLKGLKFGFVDWESQEHMKKLHEAIRMAAKYNMVVDIHDNYRLTGYERTYPNLLTVEGILGNEEKTTNDPYNVLTTSYARMIAGAGDFTPCFLSSRVISRSFQLALGVVFYSPLQYLHWYDQPSMYEGKSFPELKFWDVMPTTWDDTKVLSGDVTKYMCVARRSGDDWFIGTLTNQARELDIALTFLGTGKYVAELFIEDPNDKKGVEIQTMDVTSRTTLKAIMSEGGGHAVWIRKK